ncbi:AraC-like DNA-binding protein [Mucilaginibacter gracilis]|uniref:AraC-like DNA-binding protein n=1 Tax=Mucilaginibacter gracilis TaxID=423350 RepID=A0A495IXB7_9SPHI|nr:AraC family transcriptional regulator [Mucilaginibacter gracilis]RKR80698.1 AraC-like DNA-binding protein [Mucilaginibacter gracilis]
MKFRPGKLLQATTLKKVLLPDQLKALVFPNAVVDYTEGLFGSFLSQEIKGDNYSISQHHFFINEPCVLYAVAEAPVLTVNYFLKGPPFPQFTGISDAGLTENYYRMYYVPQMKNEITFRKGNYSCIYVSYQHSYLKELTDRHNKLQSLFDYVMQPGEAIRSLASGKINAKIKSSLLNLTRTYANIKEQDLMIYVHLRELLFYHIRRHNTLDDLALMDSHTDRIAALENYIDENLTKPLHIETLIKLCNVNRTDFYKLFKSHFGESPYQFIQNHRIEWAMILITTTGESIGQIAWKVGFKDISSFNKAFKNRYKSSPNTFRL